MLSVRFFVEVPSRIIFLSYMQSLLLMSSPSHSQSQSHIRRIMPSIMTMNIKATRMSRTPNRITMNFSMPITVEPSQTKRKMRRTTMRLRMPNRDGGESSRPPKRPPPLLPAVDIFPSHSCRRQLRSFEMSASFLNSTTENLLLLVY